MEAVCAKAVQVILHDPRSTLAAGQAQDALLPQGRTNPILCII